MRKTLHSGMMALMLATVLPVAAQDPDITFEITPRILRLGESATATIRLHNLPNYRSNLELPTTDGWRITRLGEQTQTQMQFVNGERQTHITRNISYRLVPLRTGETTFGPYDLTVEGAQYTLQEQTLKVLEEDEETTDAVAATLDDLLYATIETSVSDLYPQQVFGVTLKIYYRDITLASEVSLGDLPESGFTWGSFKSYGTRREEVDGQIYNVRSFTCIARALTSGTFTLQPSLRVNLVEERRPRGRRQFDPIFDSLFRQRQTVPHDLVVRPLELVIQPLPDEGRPDSFQGAVGKFNIRATVTPSEVAVGEPVNVRLEIAGKGNLDNLRPPEWETSPGLRAYEMKLTQSELNDEGVMGRRVFEQVLIPRDPSLSEIPSIELVWFNPDEALYQRHQVGPFPLVVTDPGGEERRTVTSNPTEAPQTGRQIFDSTDLLALKPLPQKFVAVSDTGVPIHQPVWLAVHLAPVGLWVLAWMAGRRNRKRAANRGQARRAQAPKHARKGIDAAKRALKSDDTEAFWLAVWQTLNDYFSNRLNVGAGEVTPAVIRDKLPGLADTHLDAAERLFARCEGARFGGAMESAEERKGDLEALQALCRAAEKRR